MSEITIVNGATQSVTVGGNTIQNVTVAAAPGVQVTAGFSVGELGVSNPADGDVLRYSGSTQKWQNSPEKLITDGGNF